MKTTYKFRVERQGKGKETDVERPVVPPPAHPVARRLALAYFVERAIEAGTVAGYAEAARSMGITRARLTQIVDLRLLPISVQERILIGDLRPTKVQLVEILHFRFHEEESPS